MGVRINGEWHEELADPGAGTYDSAADYNKASAAVGNQWGANLNTVAGAGTPGANPGANPNANGQQYSSAIQKALDALASGNREAFERAKYEWDQTFAVTQAGMTGTYAGAPTLPALTSYATQFGQWGTPTTGQQTLAAQDQYFQQQLSGINAAAALQANPFRQQQVLGQLGGLYSGQGVAGFQAPNIVPGVGTMGQNMGAYAQQPDMTNRWGERYVPTTGPAGTGNEQAPAGMPQRRAAGGTGMGYLQQMIDDIRDPTPNQTNMNQILDATPTPNKLNSVDFMRAAPSTQSMVLQAMQEKYGLNPDDAVKQIKNTLPQFQAPSAMGGVKR